MPSSVIRAAALGLLALALPAAEPAADPIAALPRLDADVAYRVALAASPRVLARDAVARGAATRPRQAAALPDPIASYQISPWTVGRGKGEPGHVATLTQAVPWPQERSARIDAARGLADA